MGTKKLNPNELVAQLRKQAIDRATKKKPTKLLRFSHDPWERQEAEKEKSWSGFVTYRDLGAGKRSIKKAADIVGVNPESLGLHARLWRWVERAAAWDRELDRVAREAKIKAAEDMAVRHINAHLLEQRVSVRELMKIDRKSEAFPDDVVLEPKEVRDLLDHGIKGERLARGEPETIAEQRHELTVGDRRGRLRSALDRQESHAVIEQLADMFLDESLDTESDTSSEDVIDAFLDDDEAPKK